MKELLQVRKELKERKPEFIRQDTQKRKKLAIKWRKPKGIHSKMRHHFKGKRTSPSPGHKSPSKVRGLHSSGLKIVNVSSMKDLENIRKDSEGIVISGAVGIKKSYDMLKKAKEAGIEVLNLNVDEKIKKIEDFISSKKKVNESKKAKEEPKKPEQKKEAGEAKEQELTEEKKKEAEKKEKDRLLTKKA